MVKPSTQYKFLSLKTNVIELFFLKEKKWSIKYDKYSVYVAILIVHTI